MNEEYYYGENPYQSEYQTNEFREVYDRLSYDSQAAAPAKSSGRPWAIVLAVLAVLILIGNSVFIWQMGNNFTNQYSDLNSKIAALQEQVSGEGQGGDLYDSISAFNTIKDSVVFIECSTQLVGYNFSGSGWIISSSGHIVTCQHVIDGARFIRVTLNSGNRVDATVVASDFNRDIAILKINPPGGISLKVAKVAETLPVQGQPLLTVGYPESFNIGSSQMSVFLGVCSAVKKIGNANQTRYEYTFVQSDAAMNRGNSGGPLINMKGEIVGMVSWGFDFADMEDIGFALACTEIRSYLAANGLSV